MTIAWPNIRYWVAIFLAFVSAILAISSLGMGGPRGIVGWFSFALFLSAPIALWWTRGNKAAPLLQYAVLAITLLTAGYFAIVAMAA
jgi:hypothetical protein